MKWFRIPVAREWIKQPKYKLTENERSILARRKIASYEWILHNFRTCYIIVTLLVYNTYVFLAGWYFG